MLSSLARSVWVYHPVHFTAPSRHFCQKQRKFLPDYLKVLIMSSEFSIYNSLESILNILRKEENENIPGVQELLKIYEEAEMSKLQSMSIGEVKKYPLIVLEGLDGSGKTTVGKRFASKIKAAKWKTPPESISLIRNSFDNNPDLRTAYYSLGNYIAALEVQCLLNKSPVVMDRYWHSTAAYAIAQSIQDNPDKHAMPPAGDKVYKWPDDLFKPDAVLFLNVSEDIRKQRQSRRQVVTVQEDLLNANMEFRKNVIQAYKNMFDPGVIIINGDLGFGLVLKQLQEKTKHLLMD